MPDLRRPVVIATVLLAAACSSGGETPVARPTSAATAVAPTAPHTPDPALREEAIAAIPELDGYALDDPSESLDRAIRRLSNAVLDSTYEQRGSGEFVVREIVEGNIQRGFVVAQAVRSDLADAELTQQAAQTLSTVLAQRPPGHREEQVGDHEVYRAENPQLEAHVAAYAESARTIVAFVAFEPRTLDRILAALAG